jgi:hypothetical protein
MFADLSLFKNSFILFYKAHRDHTGEYQPLFIRQLNVLFYVFYNGRIVQGDEIVSRIEDT